MTRPEPPLPDPALVVLVGASGSGKSTWAAARYAAAEVVSSDRLRAVVGSGPHDLDASADAFDLLERIVAARAGRRLTTVVDTLGLEPARRRAWRELAARHGLPAVAVVLDTPAAVCRARNSARDIPVPAPGLTAQLRRVRAVAGSDGELAVEGWDTVLTVAPEPPVAGAVGATAGPAAEPRASPAGGPGLVRSDGGLRFVLQVSRFPWAGRPAGWLTEVALAAETAGFAGIAVMDHLIQIPQVGRAWDELPEPFTTLAFLAALPTGLALGPLVSPVTFRAAGIVAKTVATLDALSGGRAFLGLGAGWWEREHAAYGLAFPAAARRLDALEDAVVTVRALWAPGTKPFGLGRVRLPETTCYPRPVGPVPVVVGGPGERRTLRIAAEHADGCNVRSDPDVVAHKSAVLRRHCAAAGRDPAEVAVTVLDLPLLGEDREQVAAVVERLRGRTPAADYARRHGAGVAAAHVARFERLRELGVATVFVSPPDLAGPDQVRRFAPVIAALG